MSIELTQGVTLHVLPTEKYKTTRIMIRFAAELDKATISKRTLLSSLMETNSLTYPTQSDISRKLAELYGAGFSIDVMKKGSRHFFTVTLNLVDESLLSSGSTVFEDGVAFLRDILFHPNVTGGQFDQETFEREQRNLVKYIASVFDDKQSYAALSLQELYFANSDSQKTPSFGTTEDILKETAASLAAYYQQMLAEDAVDIFVMGNMEEQYVAQCFEGFGLAPRQPVSGGLFYNQPVQNIIRQKTETLPVIQSKLNLGYFTDIYFHDEQYFPLLVFNGLFGGFPHSKLFMNVREAHSLAYYASSSIDTFRGMMTVQTGIDGANRDKVLRLISEQLKELAQGIVSDTELLQTKRMLQNQYLLSLDNQRALMEQRFLEMQLPQSRITDEEWLERVAAVSLDDVQRVAQQTKLQAVYFMEGGAE